MTEEEIEKVARAIAEARDHRPDDMIQVYVLADPIPAWQMYVHDASAAITALDQHREGKPLRDSSAQKETDRYIEDFIARNGRFVTSPTKEEGR